MKIEIGKEIKISTTNFHENLQSSSRVLTYIQVEGKV